jgi:two-component system, chemotaxis family, CheB/CheR fusion protein
LPKPVKPEALIQQIDLLLSARKAAVRSAPETSRSSEKGDHGTVFVIDDDVDIVDTMRELLEARGWAVETYLSCEAFLKSDHPGRTGCVLVDALLPGMSGLDLLRRLKQQGHRLPAIMVTGHGDIRMAVDAMAAGALDFIQKPVRHEELFSSLERALESLLGSPKLITWRKSAVTRAATLTRRQRQIMELVLSGLPSKNIAADLGISQRTVENHRAVIMKKMGATSLPELIRLGLAAG